jgi:hypothetical protein
MSVVSLLAPRFERYLTLEGVHPTATYDYKARGFIGSSVIETTMHLPKCGAGESWLYVAVPTSANLATLSSTEKLYVGSEKGDRMFRGDGMRGLNFHHAEMRSGNGQDNPVSFLRSGRKVHIYRITAAAIAEMVEQTSSLRRYKPLLYQPPRKGKHVGCYFEQLILYTEAKEWRWNSAGAKDTGLLRTL